MPCGLADMVNEQLDDELGPSTRVMFMNTVKRLSQESPNSSVNFRGIMDSVSWGHGCMIEPSYYNRGVLSHRHASAKRSATNPTNKLILGSAT